MRAGTNKKDWIVDNKGGFIGLSLGHDFCFEHENGVSRLHRALGVPDLEFPIGTGDRKISVCPEQLSFVTYEIKPKDKRRKTSAPAASLILMERGYRELTHEEVLKSCGLKFYTNVYDKWHAPQDDLMCSWDEREFGINVRGAENVNRLRELYEAFQRCDIALAYPSSSGFLRTGLSFAIASKIPRKSEDVIREQDMAHQRLHLAAKATGVYQMLEKAGLRYFALAPGWDNSKDEDDVVFFLNPEQQSRFNHGWFTVAELQDWAQGKGPVIKDEALIAFDKAHVDWECNLIRGLEKHQLGLRRLSRLVWMDSGKTKVGVHIRPSKKSEKALPEGVYPFDELMAKYGHKEEAAEAST